MASVTNRLFIRFLSVVLLITSLIAFGVGGLTSTYAASDEYDFHGIKLDAGTKLTGYYMQLETSKMKDWRGNTAGLFYSTDVFGSLAGQRDFFTTKIINVSMIYFLNDLIYTDNEGNETSYFIAAQTKIKIPSIISASRRIYIQGDINKISLTYAMYKFIEHQDLDVFTNVGLAFIIGNETFNVQSNEKDPMPFRCTIPMSLYTIPDEIPIEQLDPTDPDYQGPDWGGNGDSEIPEPVDPLPDVEDDSFNFWLLVRELLEGDKGQTLQVIAWIIVCAAVLFALGLIVSFFRVLGFLFGGGRRYRYY